MVALVTQPEIRFFEKIGFLDVRFKKQIVNYYLRMPKMYLLVNL